MPRRKKASYDPFSTGSFSPKVCFLCGTRLSKVNRTGEHVFPQWLIRHFHLNTRSLKNHAVDEQGNLSHGRSYEQIQLPCCRTCNSAVLAPVEARLQEALVVKRSDESSVDSDLFVWAAKIFYGYYLREQLDGYFDLAASVRNDAADYSGLRTIFLFLQSVRFGFELRGDYFFQLVECPLGFPASAIVFNVKLHRDVQDQFDYKDDWRHECVYLRLGKKAILVAFDGGYLLHHGGHFFSDYRQQLLHPKQMEELAARFFHMAEVRRDQFRFVKYEEKGKTILDYDATGVQPWPINQHAILSKPAFDLDENSARRYVQLLSQFTRQQIENISSPDGNVTSWLKGPDSAFLDIDVDRAPAWLTMSSCRLRQDVVDS